MESIYSNISAINGTALPEGVGEMPAFRMIGLQRVNRIICACFALPLNGLVMVVIARSRQLWSPRNIFWIGVCFFNVIATCQTLGELSIFYLHEYSDGREEFVCKMYALFTGGPYGTLLACLTLASFDRYLALARQPFYHNHASTKVAVWLLFLTFIFIFGLQTSPYWTGTWDIVYCGIRYDWMAFTLLYHLLLSIICLAVQTHLFLFIRRCVRFAPVLMDLQLAVLNGRGINNTSSPGEESVERQRQRIFNRLELRAAWILGFGILPFCLVTLTLCISSFVFVILRIEGIEVEWMEDVILTLRELLIIHLAYIPSVFVTQSREFRSAVKRICRFPRFQSVELFR